MSIGNIGAGTTGTFEAQLEDNGVAVSLPAGATFTWSSSDTTVVITPSTDTLSATVEVPAADEGTTLTVTASTTINGAEVSGSVAVELTPIPHVFTVKVTQTA